MATFISVSVNAFAELFEQTRGSGRQAEHRRNVRRPVRGIQAKENTYAVIRVITATGEEIPILDSSSNQSTNDIGRSSYYSNFILQNVDEQRVEKQQLVETFGESYIFFFGERPRIMTFKGVLMNTRDFNWKAEFLQNYEQYLRGTKLVEANARMYMYYDDTVIEGYPLSCQVQDDSMSPNMVGFTMQVFVTNYATLSTVGGVFIEGRDSSETVGIQASSPAELQAARMPGTLGRADGGLFGFLAQAQQAQTNASFSIQRTLEIIKRTFYGRDIVVPQGLGSQLAIGTISNNAQLPTAPTGQPIFKQRDEYVESDGESPPAFDDAELARVQAFNALNGPMELEARARAELASRGVIVNAPSVGYLLLGRAAFAGLQAFGSFGTRRAGGVLNLL